MRSIALVALGAVACAGGEGSPDDGPTWHADVAPVIAEKCGDCHYDGGPGPFDARDLEQVRDWAPAMIDAVEAGRMPPFAAQVTDECEPRVWFKDDGRFLPEERALFQQWVDADMPEGRQRDAAQIPARRLLEIDQPDAVLPIPEPFAVGGNRDIYQCFRIEVPADGDRWITGLQVYPDNDRVVHHVLVWSDPSDQSLSRVGPDGSYACSGEPDVWPTELIATWTPGQQPMRTPEGTGVTLRNGSTIVVNVHYHPTGDSTEFDQTEIAIEWTDQRPEKYATWYLVDLPFGAEESEFTGEFSIPAGASSHVEEVVLRNPIPIPLPIFAISPHMHYLGKSMKVTIERCPDEYGPEQGCPEQELNEQECLVQVPHYRFDFQQSYVYDAPENMLPTINYGDTVRVRCEYDNSMENPYIDLALEASNATSPVNVGWGEETGDEMCMAMAGLISPVEIIDYLDNF